MLFKRKPKKQYLVRLSEQDFHNKRVHNKYYAGFDGELAYDFLSKQKAVVFDNKRKAKKEIKKLKKDCSFDFDYQKLEIVEK